LLLRLLLLLCRINPCKSLQHGLQTSQLLLRLCSAVTCHASLQNGLQTC
jgi:hypothetical protein